MGTRALPLASQAGCRRPPTQRCVAPRRRVKLYSVPGPGETGSNGASSSSNGASGGAAGSAADKGGASTNTTSSGRPLAPWTLTFDLKVGHASCTGLSQTWQTPQADSF